MKKEAVRSALLFLLLALAVCLAVFFICTSLPLSEPSLERVSAEGFPTVVIDAGHGGRDGGAVGEDGTLEKDLNLQIARVLSELLKVSGYNVVMTRNEDVMLSTEDSVGSAKLRDLKKRLMIASSYPEAVTVSIHCNKFPSEDCRGLQVYYSDNETAKALAVGIQESTVSLLQPENHRKAKLADSSIYILDRAKTPSVLIECGFLSNTEERERLKNADYQRALALAVLVGITEVY